MPAPAILTATSTAGLVTDRLGLALAPPPLRAGDAVAVRNRLDGRWAEGFRVDAVIVDDDGYQFRVRRLSDGALLPTLFPEDALVGTR